MPPIQWYLSKVVLVAVSGLLGAFFVHWLADHSLIWQGTDMPPHAVETSLRYYSMFYHAPPYYGAVLSGLALAALGATLVKLVMNPVQGLLFEGATFVLLSSAMAVYTSNVLAALRYLPLDQLKPGSKIPSSILSVSPFNNLGQVRLVEALQSVAASHMIIAVSLTGVLALQGAQGWAERPTTAALPVKPAAGVVAATQTAPIPVKGEKVPEKGLHET